MPLRFASTPRLASFLSIVVILACSGGGGEEQVVEGELVPADRPGPAPKWSLEPLWESSDTLLLSSTYTMAADSRGRLYVYDRDLGIVLLSAEGEAIRKIGHSGEGPGEYQYLADLQVSPGDTLLAWDPGLARLSAYEPDSGRFVRSRTFRIVEALEPGHTMTSQPWSIHRLSGSQERYLLLLRPMTSPEDDRGGFVVRVVGAGGEVVRDSILVFAQADRVTLKTGGRIRSIFDHPLGSRGMVEFGVGDQIYYVQTDTPRFRILDSRGDSTGGFTFYRERFPVTDDDIERVIERWRNMEPPLPASDDGWEEQVREGAPPRHPLFSRFLVDDGGRIWIPAPHQVGDPVRTAEWEIFSGDGERLGVLEDRPRGALLEVRGERAYGVAFDSLGVPTIWGARIRPGASRGIEEP